MPGKKMTPKGLTPRQKMELKKGKGKNPVFKQRSIWCFNAKSSN